MTMGDRVQILLKEYELCQDRTKHLENNIWTTSGIIGLGSMASLLLANIETANHWPRILVGLFLIFMAWIWWGMAKRWWDIQHSTFLRMRHIEEEIQLYQIRYIEYFNKAVNQREEEILKGLDDKKIKCLSKKFPDFHKEGIQTNLRWLPVLITAIWGIYILVIVFT